MEDELEELAQLLEDEPGTDDEVIREWLPSFPELEVLCRHRRLVRRILELCDARVSL